MYRKPLMLAIALIAAVFGMVMSPTSAKSAGLPPPPDRGYIPA